MACGMASTFRSLESGLYEYFLDRLNLDLAKTLNESTAHERSTETNNGRANRNTCGARLNEIVISEACNLNVAVVSVPAERT
jgi:hypothetical protein